MVLLFPLIFALSWSMHEPVIAKVYCWVVASIRRLVLLTINLDGNPYLIITSIQELVVNI
jgi:hypothetical protein